MLNWARGVGIFLLALILSVASFISEANAQGSDTIAVLPTVTGDIAGSVEGKFSVGALGTANYDISIDSA